ncbi:MAG: hypothetical protein JXQ87_05665 [Bacteroidia bacterium]
MKRDHVIATLQQQVTALQELISQLKNSENLEFTSIELALFESKLISFYDDILKLKAGKSKPSFTDVKLDSASAGINQENETYSNDVDSIKTEFENLKGQFASEQKVEKKPIITFEPEEEKSEENIDAELEDLMNIAAQELNSPKEPSTSSQKSIVTEAAKENTNATESSKEEPTTQINKTQSTRPQAEPKPQISQPKAEDKPKPVATDSLEEKTKPASLNERHKQVQDKPSLLDKLASNRKPDLSRQMAGKPIKDLKKAISLNQQIKFQRELFENDKRAYRKAIDFINKCNTYSEARSYVEHELAAEFSNCKAGNPAYDAFMGLVKRRFI